jgi:hypothetical protein
VSTLKGIGNVYMHAAVDIYGSYAFGFLHAGKRAECAAVLIHNDVLPLYESHGLEVSVILTDNGPEFCGTANHPYEMYLVLDDIEHRRTKVRTSQTNDFIRAIQSHCPISRELFRTNDAQNVLQNPVAYNRKLKSKFDAQTQLRTKRSWVRIPPGTPVKIVQFDIRTALFPTNNAHRNPSNYFFVVKPICL